MRNVQKSAKELDKLIDKAISDREKDAAKQQEDQTAAHETATTLAALPALPAAPQRKADAGDMAIFASDTKDIPDAACIGIEDMDKWNGAFILAKLKDNDVSFKWNLNEPCVKTPCRFAHKCQNCGGSHRKTSTKCKHAAAPGGSPQDE